MAFVLGMLWKWGSYVEINIFMRRETRYMPSLSRKGPFTRTLSSWHPDLKCPAFRAEWENSVTSSSLWYLMTEARETKMIHIYMNLETSWEKQWSKK